MSTLDTTIPAAPMPNAVTDTGQTRVKALEITPSMIEAAAEAIWRDRDARMGGPWCFRSKDEVCVIQTKATAHAALRAALATLEADAGRGEVEMLTKAGWKSLDTAPEDEWVLLATTGGHVGEAIMYLDDASGKPDWQWAANVRLHAELTPLGWQHMPRPISSPILSDNRPGGFDGPTGAD